MTDATSLPRENQDPRKVDAAVKALADGRLPEAEAILTDVLSRVPANYVCQFERNGEFIAEFWNSDEFLHFCTSGQGSPYKKVLWTHNAYPRAYYYMGYICIKKQQPERAITFLDAGLALQPRHPMLQFEKARALTLLKQYPQAFALYREVAQRTDISPKYRSIGANSLGYALAEQGDLAAAEAAFKEALTFDPDDPDARHELAHIGELRAATSGPAQTARKSWWQFWK